MCFFLIISYFGEWIENVATQDIHLFMGHPEIVSSHKYLFNDYNWEGHPLFYQKL